MHIRRQLASFATLTFPLSNVPGNCLVIMETRIRVPQTHTQPVVWSRDALRYFFLSSGYPIWGCFLMTFNFHKEGSSLKELSQKGTRKRSVFF